MRNDCTCALDCLPVQLVTLELGSTGDAAKNAFHTNPQNTVFDAKRLIGRRMDEPELQRDIKHFPFKVVDKGGKPSIQVKYHGDTRDFVRSDHVQDSWACLMLFVDS